MKTQLLCLFIGFTFLFKLNAQTPLLVSEKKTERDNETQEVVKETTILYTYNQADILTSKTTSIDGKEMSKKEYDYDQNGNWIFQIEWSYNSSIDALDTVFLFTLKYNELNNRTERIYSTKGYDANFVTISSKTTYSYDDNDCLIGIETYRPISPLTSGQVEFELSGYEYFERGEMCQNNSRQYYTNSTEGKNDFTYDNQGYLIEKLNYLKGQNQNWVLNNKETYDNDNQGRPLNTFTYNSSNDLVKRIIYEYENLEDDFTLELVEVYQTDTDTWFEAGRTEFEISPLGERTRTFNASSSISQQDQEVSVYYEKHDNTYDSDGFLTDQDYERQWVVGNDTRSKLVVKNAFTNRCDGLVKTRTYIVLEFIDRNNPNPGEIGNPNTTVFNYSNPAACETPKEIYDISISPNPATEAFTLLVSDLLFISGTTVKLFNSSGQLLREFTSVFGDQIELDLSNLAAGVYPLILENKTLDKFVTDKIVIAHR